MELCQKFILSVPRTAKSAHMRLAKVQGSSTGESCNGLSPRHQVLDLLHSALSFSDHRLGSRGQVAGFRSGFEAESTRREAESTRLNPRLQHRKPQTLTEMPLNSTGG
eukprot:1148306-Rhodomonas_salina.1